jgi:class 3 adenylate cyclase
MAIDVADWLRGLSLEQYAKAFRDSDIDESVLGHLTADDLIEVGVASIGHRRKLLAAIAALKSEPAVSTPARSDKAAATPAERRQLTVMFCDIVGSTAISSGLDPEDFILNRPDEAEECASTCQSLAQKFSLGNYVDYANLMQGWIRVLRGDVDNGLREAEDALLAMRSVASRRFHYPIRIATVGRARAAAGDITGALALFDDALNEVSINGERWYEAELLRLKAEMLLAQATPRTGDAEQCLQAAIALAKEQDAKFWELRAATALGEHWTAAGRPDEARNLLAPVYGSFTQGLDSPDLKRAAALIA